MTATSLGLMVIDAVDPTDTTDSIAAWRSSALASPDARTANTSAPQAISARAANTPMSAARPKETSARTSLSAVTPTITRERNHACAITRTAVSVPMTIAPSMKIRVVRAYRNSRGSTGFTV